MHARTHTHTYTRPDTYARTHINLNGMTQHATRESVRTIFVYGHVPEAVRPEAETYGSTADQEKTGANYCREM